MKKKLFLLLSIITLTFGSCSSDDGTSLMEETTTTTTTTSTTENDSESATLNLTLSGRDNYENIFVSIRIGKNNNVLEALEEVSNDGTISLNVTSYINKDLVIKVHEKTGNVTAVLDGTTKTRTIVENENNLTISIPEALVYGAKIEVTIDGIAESGTTVYAVPSTSWLILLPFIKTQGSSVLSNSSNIESKVTGSDGFVEFEDLNVSLGTEYHFVVVTNEPISRSGGTYEEIILDIDGTLKNGTINLESAITGNISVNLSDSSETGILVEVYDENNTVAYSKTSTSSIVTFSDIPVGTYEIYASKLSKCLFAEQKSKVTVSENKTSKKTIEFRRSLKLINKSDNPYTITIIDSKNNKTSFIMEGNTEVELDLPTGATSINVVQNSGYLFFATEKDFNIIISCNKTHKQSFPE